MAELLSYLYREVQLLLCGNFFKFKKKETAIDAPTTEFMIPRLKDIPFRFERPGEQNIFFCFCHLVLPCRTLAIK